jgi:gas vesicle protein
MPFRPSRREEHAKERESMSQGNTDQLTGFVAGLLLGTLIGATAAYLTAPQSGKKTRKRLGKAAVGIRKSGVDRWDELAEEVKDRVDDAISGARKKLGSG